MKRRLVPILFLAVVCCFFSVSVCNAGMGEVKFGTGVTKDWQLINEAREFDTNLITCGFYCSKPLGVMQVAVSIYYQENPSDQNETLLTRANLDVNPEWGIMIIPELPLPGIGHYTFTMSTTDGATLAKGSLTITEKNVEEEMPEQPKVEGTTLEGLFNKFKP